MIWDYTNFLTTKNKVTYTIHCPIDRFYFRKKGRLSLHT